MNSSTLRGSKASGAGRPLIYLDHNATTPLSECVRSHLLEWADEWGNPSSIHQAGRGPKALMRKARENVAKMLGVHSLEIIFTSGGSEANNYAIKGVFNQLNALSGLSNGQSTASALSALPGLGRILVSTVEHPSVQKSVEALAALGVHVDYIPVDRKGNIDLAHYEALLQNSQQSLSQQQQQQHKSPFVNQPPTTLVSVMLANNETGNLFPIKRMAELAHAYGALFHSDCVQTLGKINIDLRDLGVDLATFSGHKFYGLKGAGVLYAKRGVQLKSLIHGGGQERHRRGGTENVLAISSLSAMCEFNSEVTVRAQKMAKLRDELERRLCSEISDLSVTGIEGPRLPNTSSMVISGVDGEILLMNLDMRGFAVSTGAACSSGSPEPSATLLAMGLSRAEAQNSLRVSIGWETTELNISNFIDTLKDVVSHIRSIRDKANQNSLPYSVQDSGKQHL
jgi:cysteine desulfurase